MFSNLGRRWAMEPQTSHPLPGVRPPRHHPAPNPIISFRGKRGKKADFLRRPWITFLVLFRGRLTGKAVIKSLMIWWFIKTLSCLSSCGPTRAEARVLTLGILISVREVRRYACCQMHKEKQDFKKKKEWVTKDWPSMPCGDLNGKEI